MGGQVIEVAFPACRCASLGLGRDGSISGNGSGDIFIAFSAANPHAENGKEPVTIKMLPNDNLGAIFAATLQAVEESTINAMIAAETVIENHKVMALPRDPLPTVPEKLQPTRSIAP